MSAGQPPALVLFEPWSLGDVIVAASILRELPAPAALACHSGWHPILRAALRDNPALQLLVVDLPYTTRTRMNVFDTTGALAAQSIPEGFDVVLSIRGDPRDYAAARKMFPRAQIKMRGWIRFLGRKSAVINFPYALGLRPVQNRYRSWAEIAGVPYEQIEDTYRRLQTEAPANGRIAIHLGAQWRSKQFPEVASLRDQLVANGWTVMLLAGPGDQLPSGIEDEAVTRAVSAELVTHLKSVEHVITNDSGPMHLAAFLGCRTTAIVRTSPIEEWAPPLVNVGASQKTPRGYRPHKHYMSDSVLADWPSVATISASLQTRACTSLAGAGQSAKISE